MHAYKHSETRILVVDDALKNIQVIGKLLRNQGFLVSAAQSGKQALEIASKDRPDLILLDIIMPEMDGMETCRLLKEDRILRAVPVVFLSALTDTSDKVRGFKAGAVDYVTKPIDSEELLARIHLHLTLKSLQEDLESQVEIRTRELTRINEALRRREEEYRSLMEAVPDPIIVYDLDRRTLYVNPAFTRVFGWTWEDLKGKRPDFIVDGEFQRTMDAFAKTYEKGHVEDFQTRRSTKDGRILDVSISGASFQGPDGKVMGAVANIRDITEWKQTQEIMIQNEKMMSLGGLAAGMAHEIKNPLSAIIQNAQVVWNRLFRELPANTAAAAESGLDFDSLQKYLKKRNIDSLMGTFRDAGIRVNTIIDNMLSFSRKSESRQLPADLSKILEKSVELASQDYDLKKNYDFRRINIVRRYDPALPMVPCEESKIEQVFFNILKNGGEALHESGTEKPEFILTTWQENGMACVEIVDNGPGMDLKIQKRIFEPFFTTKEQGVGTGLGLSVSYFIVKKGHGGSLEVTSHPGKGAKFIIRLPLEPV